MINYIDLFSGAGGFTLGLETKGFNNIFSIDFEPSFCDTYEFNFPTHKLIRKDIKELSKNELKEVIDNRKVDLIVGGPPCQGFSMAGNIGRKFLDDDRNLLFKEFIRVVSIVKPNFFIMENVARLYTHNNGNTRLEIIKEFEKLGYKVECKIICSADYGVPQVRNRVIFIGNNIGIDNVFPKKNVDEYVTIKQCIDDLPKLKSGEVSKLENHCAMKHTQQMLQKMKYVSDGGDRNQIPENIRPKKGDIRKYIRYDSNKPSICITGDMRKVFHYSQNRALTVRELARIQSFPDTFIFKGSSISQQQQIGNAVPPKMAEELGECILLMNKIGKKRNSQK